jgi:hypothetical protein
MQLGSGRYIQGLKDPKIFRIKPINPSIQQVAQDPDLKPPSGLIRPVQVALPGSNEFEQGIPFVAAVDNF